MKWAFPCLVLLLFCMLPLNASARAIQRPAYVWCLTDGCDGVLPHATQGSGGSYCLSNIEDRRSVNLTDRDGRVEGTLHLFESITCATQWATVYANSTYMTALNVYTWRLHSNYPNSGDDDKSEESSWQFPYYSQGQWLDVWMLGEDYENPDDCLHAEAHWEDRYGTWRDTNTSAWCA